MSNNKRKDLSDRVGADFFRSDKDSKDAIESKQQDSKYKSKTTFYISPELHKKLRIECAEKGIRISSFIEDLLLSYFDSKKL